MTVRGISGAFATAASSVAARITDGALIENTQAMTARKTRGLDAEGRKTTLPSCAFYQLSIAVAAWLWWQWLVLEYLLLLGRRGEPLFPMMTEVDNNINIS